MSDSNRTANRPLLWAANGCLAIVITLGLPDFLSAEPWPQWSGPNRNWRTSEPAGEWPPVKRWEKTIGNGDSSPILVDGRVFFTSLDGDRTAVNCLAAETGDVLWTQSSPGGRYGRFAHGDREAYYGPLSTPACDGKLLFTLSVDGDLACWDVDDGKPQWGLNLYERYRMGERNHIRDYGYTSSPMLAGDKIYVEVGGNRGAVMAFRKRDGREAGGWGRGQVGHSSGPAGPNGRVFFGLDALWIRDAQFAWRTDYACNIATPAVSGPYVVCTSDYNIRRTTCYERGQEKWSVRNHEKSHSPVIHEEQGNVYLAGRGECLDLKDGHRKWRFGACSSVIITADDKLLVFGSPLRLYDTNGNKLHEFDDVPTQGWSSGAFGDGTILCKNRSQLACYSWAPDGHPPEPDNDLGRCAIEDLGRCAIELGGETSAPTGGALAGDRPRVIISTDIGGSDPDDFQSMVHLLMYADALDIEGLISSPPNAGRAKHIHECLDAYAKDYASGKRGSSGFPSPSALRDLVKQGATDASPIQGFSPQPTEGSRWIVQRAGHHDDRPLWVLVWGSITDLAQAVHDAPRIKPNLRVYSIGSWNTRNDRPARDYLFDQHPDLWWVESDTTFRGMYLGGQQDGDLGNRSFVEQHIKDHGALGNLFYNKKRDIKMGDTPSVLFLLRGNLNDPTEPSWGGTYVKTQHGPNYWHDDPAPSQHDAGHDGAKSVNRWREAYLRDWQTRLAGRK